MKTRNEDNLTIMTAIERERAIKYYGYGWNLQEITDRILHNRIDLIRRDMLRAVGMCISKRLNRQMYPVEFYGDVKE